ncbi:MAG TPA: SDR family oxidoreductase [Jatrophihabitantaceae bacterium]|jgi:NAD(P)-dependent dehydrogenase (short-subunit alcohol dehydrogenase family)|nr:SDR family oxidoreductase [Jatrophihabitantaceae bacterium]
MAKQARSLRGKIVVITGGARGIGRATATALAVEGAHVVIGDLDAELTARAAKEIGPDVVGVRLDVTDHAGFTAALDEIERDIGPIDILINNAGIMPVSMFEDETPESTARQVAVNFLAPLHGTRDAIGRMKPRRRGHIVNVASMAGVIPTPGASTYSATKHAVVGLTESVSWELRGSGVDISCVLPALVNTELAVGIQRTRASRTIEPEVVATEIVNALKWPKLMVFAPKSMAAITKWSGLLPRAVGDKMMTATGSDHLLADAITTGERADYEARVAASTPASDPAHP